MDGHKWVCIECGGLNDVGDADCAYCVPPCVHTVPSTEITGTTLPTDEIDHPNHYSRWKMEPIEFIAINDLPWWLANLIKYTMRYDAKDGLKDMYKGRSYLDMKIRQLEGIRDFWKKPVAEERRLNKK